MARALTAAGIARYKPGKVRREIRDGAATGLYLILQESGQRSFALRFRKPNGKPAKLTLGPVDVAGVEQAGTPVLGAPLTLAGARALASEIHRQRAQGRDVIADHAASKHRRQTEHDENAANGFGALARQFIAEHAKPRTRRWRACARLLGLRSRPAAAQRWADRWDGPRDAGRPVDGVHVVGAASHRRNKSMHRHPAAGCGAGQGSRADGQRDRRLLACVRRDRRTYRAAVEASSADRLPTQRGRRNDARRIERRWCDLDHPVVADQKPERAW